jgi:DNA-binding response OmpR family regulator
MVYTVAKILIVDDDADIRMALSLTLEEAGYSVCEAADGDEAFEKALISQPDAVLLDISMPGQDGFDVLQDLRLQPATAGIPVLMLSGKTELHNRERARVLGAFDFITKPWAEGEVETRTDWAIKSGGNPAQRVCEHPELDPVAA